MHDLIPLGPALLPGVLTMAEIDATMAYAEAEKAPATGASILKIQETSRHKSVDVLRCLCQARRSLQGSRRGGLPLTCQMHTAHIDNAPS